ncbi:MAG: hypothetical protein AAFY15_07460 [Cyanobacteria bacterium J06648_11]
MSAFKTVQYFITSPEIAEQRLHSATFLKACELFHGWLEDVINVYATEFFQFGQIQRLPSGDFLLTQQQAQFAIAIAPNTKPAIALKIELVLAFKQVLKQVSSQSSSQSK